jgi:NAD(P)-dependent dehydrogenase (short-subunit alcohol dehydrogenase family)
MERPKIALVFGATGGIGSALSRRLHLSGFQLALAARDPSRLQVLARELSALELPGDVTTAETVDAAFTTVQDQLGSPPSAVALCVGSILLKPAHLTSDADWDKTLALNLTSAFRVVRAAARAMATTGGSVALVSSVAAGRGLANHEAIGAAKAGLEGLMRSAAATYARQGLRFNAVAPSLTETPLAASMLAQETTRRYSAALHPLGRWGQPDDVASALAWLLDPAQSWITGQVLSVDGGLSAVQAR